MHGKIRRWRERVPVGLSGSLSALRFRDETAAAAIIDIYQPAACQPFSARHIFTNCGDSYCCIHHICTISTPFFVPHILFSILRIHQAVALAPLRHD